MFRLHLYTVDFNTGGGTVIPSQNVQEESCVENVDDPSKPGYTFDKWDYDFTSPVLSDLTINAIWKPIIYTITFDTNGGDELEQMTKSIIYGAGFRLPTPTYKGHTFMGWKYNNEIVKDGIWSIANDVTLVASWTNNKYKLTYDCSGGSFEDDIYIQEITFGDHFTLKEPTRNGYDFDSWYLDNSIFTSDKWLFDNDITLVAHWIAKKYTIHFDSDGGNILDDMVVTFGNNVNLPTPNKKGYDFLGWYNGEIPVSDGEWSIASDITLKAKYEIKTYSILLSECSSIFGSHIFIEENKGQPLIEDFINGCDYEMPKIPYKKNNYFTGWHLDASLETRLEKDDNLSDNQTLYAGYQPFPSGSTNLECSPSGDEYRSTDWHQFCITLYSAYAGNYKFRITFNKSLESYNRISLYAYSESTANPIFESNEFILSENGGCYCEFSCELKAFLKYTIITPLSSELTDRTITVNYDYSQKFGSKIHDDYVIKTEYDSHYALGVPFSQNNTFVGWYTEQNGNGEKLTDNLGNSLSQYSFDQDISAYPCFK